MGAPGCGSSSGSWSPRWPGTERPEPRAEVGRALARLTRGAAVQEVARRGGLQPAAPQHRGPRRVRGRRRRSTNGIARFSGSRALLGDAAGNGRVSLAAVAAASGYADQAHLTREWQALAGCTPTTWLRTEFPFLQDLADRWATG